MVPLGQRIPLKEQCALGACASGLLVDWQLPVGFDAEGAAGRVAAEPDVWTDGSLLRIRSLVLLHQVQGFLLVVLVIFGPIVGGVILMMTLVGTGSFGLAVAVVLFLVRYILYSGLSSGRSFLHFRLLMAFTYVLIIWVLYVMSVALCVLLSLSRMVILFRLLIRCFSLGF